MREETMCNSAILERARSYEKCNVPKTVGEKPVFHFSVPTGWMNDPNGFSYFCGTYHLFFQYNPYSTEWGPMHWGHCTTKDFVHWEILPCAMAPDAFFDNEGCFSGTAVESGGKHVLLYTGVQGKTDGNGKPYTVQNQCVAFGDGVNYEKYKGNPVISSSMLPEVSSTITTFALLISSSESPVISKAIVYVQSSSLCVTVLPGIGSSPTSAYATPGKSPKHITHDRKRLNNLLNLRSTTFSLLKCILLYDCTYYLLLA